MEANRKIDILRQHYGDPKRLIIDEAFILDALESLCKENQIELHAITTGVPRGNGQVERIHSVLKAIFTKLTVDERILGMSI